MARSVTIASGKNNVLLPDGGTYNDGDTVTLTDAQFDEIRDALIPGTIIDNGATGELGDAVVTQAPTVAAPVALTGAAPAAQTSTAPAALTAAAAAGANPTDAEFDALLADVTALRTTLAAGVADVTALRTSLAAAVVDIAAIRTKQAAILTALKGAGKPMASA